MPFTVKSPTGLRNSDLSSVVSLTRPWLEGIVRLNYWNVQNKCNIWHWQSALLSQLTMQALDCLCDNLTLEIILFCKCALYPFNGYYNNRISHCSREWPSFTLHRLGLRCSAYSMSLKRDILCKLELACLGLHGKPNSNFKTIFKCGSK